jgi:hypothetical protein
MEMQSLRGTESFHTGGVLDPRFSTLASYPRSWPLTLTPGSRCENMGRRRSCSSLLGSSLKHPLSQGCQSQSPQALPRWTVVSQAGQPGRGGWDRAALYPPTSCFCHRCVYPSLEITHLSPAGSSTVIKAKSAVPQVWGAEWEGERVTPGNLGFQDQGQLMDGLCPLRTPVGMTRNWCWTWATSMIPIISV